jgi:hypothetical protein
MMFPLVTLRFSRFGFIAYIILIQVFVGYVRLRAKAMNDRTPITLNNPISSLVQSQLPADGIGGNDMVKNLASQFLSSQTTIMEYDLKQAKSMNSSVIVPMIFLWFLHFKMGQVQPLLFQTASGIMNLIYSPLFQVYVLGRNLERPFKTALPNPMTAPGAAPVSEAAETEEKSEIPADVEEKDDDTEDDEDSEPEDSEAEDSEAEDDDAEDDDAYDSDDSDDED